MRSARPVLPWVVWGTAAIAYAVAVVNRSSLAALGPATQEHFGIDATTLSMFAMIQLVVYAGLQIPVGTLLDRFGPTALILFGALLMVAGQTVMATVADVWLAILARVLVGAGDACTFISVMRLLPDWFSVRQLPVVSQLTGLIGQAGQLVSVTPLALAVDAYGWTSGFLGVAAVGLLVLIIACFVVRDAPGGGTFIERITGRLGRLSREARSLGAGEPTGAFAMPPPQTELIPVGPTTGRAGHGVSGDGDGAGDSSEAGSGARAAGARQGFWAKFRRMLRIPGVRLAYWMHFTSQFSLNVFVLLWGTPFLMGGIGLDRGAAAALLNIVIVSSMSGGLLLGALSSRFVERRVAMHIAVTISIAVVWAAVLLWPGVPPIWLLVVLMVIMPLGGPASMIAFEVSRSHSPRSFAGLSTGFVNTGGFTASLLVILFIGLALDLQGAGSPEHYSLEAFEWAFAVQLPFWIGGLVMIFIEMARTRRWMQQHGRTLR